MAQLYKLKKSGFQCNAMVPSKRRKFTVSLILNQQWTSTITPKNVKKMLKVEVTCFSLKLKWNPDP